jgi:hypothetical protein
MPETASIGTLHDADAAQLPQSIRPVAGSVRQAGWDCGSVAVGLIVAIRLAPAPL